MCSDYTFNYGRSPFLSISPYMQTKLMVMWVLSDNHCLEWDAVPSRQSNPHLHTVVLHLYWQHFRHVILCCNHIILIPGISWWAQRVRHRAGQVVRIKASFQRDAIFLSKYEMCFCKATLDALCPITPTSVYQMELSAPAAAMLS